MNCNKNVLITCTDVMLEWNCEGKKMEKSVGRLNWENYIGKTNGTVCGYLSGGSNLTWQEYDALV